MTTQAHPPRNLMLGLSLGQGLVLLLLWRAVTHDTWPSRTPVLNFPLWTFAVVWPGLLLFSLDTVHRARTFGIVTLATAALMPLAAWAGWQASPSGAFPIGSFLFIYVATLLIASFKALLYVQRWAGRQPAGYDALFALSWRNFLVASLAAALAGGVQAVLQLWGLLFAAIGIDFFRDLFAQDWFVFPVLAVAFGSGVFVFRRLAALIDGITGLLEGLMRLLLPLAAALVVLFLASLPFTGLQPLWDTGNGTALLLWLNAFVLFFANAVYQTGRTAPYPPLVHRLLWPGIAVLPVLPALALYGLSLRIGEYGWSVERCWAFTVCLLLALFSVGYAWCVGRRRGDWPQGLGGVNRVLGWAVLAVMLLVNSPLLDFRTISLASQLQRVENGEIELRDFDFRYAHNHLARPGWREMQALLEAHESSDPELARRIREPAPAPPRGVRTEDVWARMAYRPEPFEVPAGVREVLDHFFADPYSLEASRSGGLGIRYPLPFLRSDLREYHDPVLVRVDLQGDDTPEYVLLVGEREHGRLVGLCVYREGEGAWRGRVLALREPLPQGADLGELLRSGEIDAVTPAFRELRIGGAVLGRI